MAQEQFSNLASSRLATPLMATDTTLTVQNASSFPNFPRFRLAINEEILIVNHIAGSVFTVTRAAEGTTANDYLAGTIVRHILTAGALYALGSEVRTPHWIWIPLLNGDPINPQLVFTPVGGFVLVTEYVPTDA